MTTPYDSYDYLGYWSNREYENQAEKMALKKLLSEIPKDKKGSMIDIGAGFGRQTPIYAPVFGKCVLLDSSEKLLAEAKSRLKKFSNLEFKLGKADELPFTDEQFEVAIIIRVVHHLLKPKGAFLEASRVLKPHGYLVVEFANKIHFRARVRAWLKGEFGFTNNLNPEEQRSPASIRAKKIVFINHHPKIVENDLKEVGFKIIDRLSVSNFRSPLVKKIIPLPILLFLESHFSLLTSHYSLLSYFGPTIFLLCQKVD
jgi:ubiquinone/menaquinone biosynthesis C-methylase UbiE